MSLYSDYNRKIYILVVPAYTMQQNKYTLDKRMKDRMFVEAVEASSAYDYLGNTKDNGHILTEKIDLLYKKGYTTLFIEGGRKSVENCKPWQISTVLRKTYEATKQKLQDYDERISAEWKEKERVWQEIRDNTTLGQFITALDGYWGRIRMDHSPEIMREQMELELGN